ncbi:hypothetical protein, partial [Petrimonas sp.]|uniref:hypothetical protein n=1 Tax=Petrimonas sp. TaxID=2023866 RepID=UPI003F512AE3
DEIITTPYTDMGTISAIISARALPKSKKKWSRKTIFIWPIIHARRTLHRVSVDSQSKSP